MIADASVALDRSAAGDDAERPVRASRGSNDLTQRSLAQHAQHFEAV